VSWFPDENGKKGESEQTMPSARSRIEDATLSMNLLVVCVCVSDKHADERNSSRPSRPPISIIDRELRTLLRSFAQRSSKSLSTDFPSRQSCTASSFIMP
jgi:hypothetical protein